MQQLRLGRPAYLNVEADLVEEGHGVLLLVQPAELPHHLPCPRCSGERHSQPGSSDATTANTGWEGGGWYTYLLYWGVRQMGLCADSAGLLYLGYSN